MSANVKNLVEKLTLEDVEKRISFNSISEEELEAFRTDFLQDTEENKISYLTKIIEETDENELLEGNFKSFFEDDVVKDLLRKCL